MGNPSVSVPYKVVFVDSADAAHDCIQLKPMWGDKPLGVDSIRLNKGHPINRGDVLSVDIRVLRSSTPTQPDADATDCA
jgi:hypothetical protein